MPYLAGITATTLTGMGMESHPACPRLPRDHGRTRDQRRPGGPDRGVPAAWVRGRGHALFRAESLLNTPLFAGFPGFVSKLWMAHDENGVYRGFYQWNGAERADAYVRALWWVLALVSDRSSIRSHHIPTSARQLGRTPADRVQRPGSRTTRRDDTPEPDPPARTRPLLGPR